MVVSFHLGSGNFGSRHHLADRLKREGLAQTFTRITVAGFLDGAQHVLDLLLSGVLDRYPDLRFFAAESGIGWLPFVLESMDYYSMRSGQDFDREMRPSDYFRRQVYASFWYEQIAPERLLDYIGEDNVVFETDFPHPSCLYPEHEVKEAMARVLEPLNEPTRRKIAYENACRMFGRDPKSVTNLIDRRSSAG
jgi:predicted TIM-barrel fold metal-dependent hydrolase